MTTLSNTLPKRIENVAIYFGKDSNIGAEDNNYKVMAILSSSPIENVPAVEKAAGVLVAGLPKIFAHVKWVTGEWTQPNDDSLPIPGPQERWLVNLVLRGNVYVATPIKFLSSRSLKAREFNEPQLQYLAVVADPALGSERK